MKKWLFVLFFVFLVCGVVFLSLNNTSSNRVLSAKEKKEAMARILDRDPILKDKAPRKWKEYKGKYISFVYPDDANIYKNNVSKQVVESFSCGTLSPRVNLAVQVAIAEDLNGYPAFMLRRGDDSYKEGVGELRGEKLVVFTKDTDGAEKSAFWQKEDKIYTIVVTGNQMQAVEDIYSKVISAISF